MIQKMLSGVLREDIESLLNAKVPEGRTLEYKQQLPGSDNDGKREFLYDVSSFANAVGGDMVFGITDERDASGKPTGLPDSIEGVTIANLSDTVARLENLIRDGIAPRIPGIEWKPVEGFPSGPVLIIRIPKSTIGPHMVIFGAMARFYSRNSTGKYPMDIREIRLAFMESVEIGEKLRALRTARIQEIMVGESSLGSVVAPVVAIQLVPFSSLGLGASRDITKDAAKLQALIQPISASSWGGRYNFDGYLVQAVSRHSYVQVFRSGLIEALDAAIFDTEAKGYGKQIPSIAFEKTLIESISRYLDVQKRLAIPLPVFITISLLHVRGFSLSSGRSLAVFKSSQIDRDIVPLPEVAVEDYGTDLGRVLQPCFDALWQTCGLEKSLNYDDVGNWRPHHS